MRHIDSVKYSWRDSLPHATNALLRRIRQTTDTVRARLHAAWWGLQLGSGSMFFGMPIIRRHPTASIVVGKQCQLRSAEWSNTIGLNRRCVIAASRDAAITIGDNCGFSGTVIAASSSIAIGNRVLCGGNCTIVDTDRHPIDPLARANNEPADSKPIIIEDDVFLSMNVVVLKGSTIGKGTVVAANSVVTSSLPAGVIAGGIPARVIRKLKRDELNSLEGY